MLRNHHDRRSVFYALVLFPLTPVLAIAFPRYALLAVPFSLYLSYAVGVITHNHTHAPLFESRFLNRLFSVWLSGFYGFPVFSWIPTHLMNHHKYVDGPLDVASTRRGEKDSFFEFLSYPSYAASRQGRLVFSYFRRQLGRPGGFWLVLQGLAVPGAQGVWLGWAFLFHDPTTALGLALLFGFLPAFLASPAMMATNYLQHVGCSSGSTNAHSRNFVTRWSNLLLFNAGYHTVHHEQPSVHWSKYPALHEARKATIPERLLARDPLSFLFARYGRRLERTTERV